MKKMMGKRKVSGKNNEETRSYFTWNLEMERVLALMYSCTERSKEFGHQGRQRLEKVSIECCSCRVVYKLQC